MHEPLKLAAELGELDEASEVHDVGDPAAIDGAHLGLAVLERRRGGGAAAPVPGTAPVPRSIPAAPARVAISAAVPAPAPPVVVASVEEPRIVRHVRGDGVIAVDLPGQRLGALHVVAHCQPREGIVGGGSHGSRRPARAPDAPSTPASTALVPAGLHALDDGQEAAHQVERQLRAGILESLLERPRLVVLPREVYDELREGLVRDAYVVLELRRHLIHQRQVRKLVERRHRVRAACPSDALCHLALQSGREDSVRKPSPKCSFGFGAKLSGIAKLAKLPTIRT